MEKYAVSNQNSKGRYYKIPDSISRNDWERDKARIIHSSAFRRLQYKTQVFENGEGDNFRTRLTHSLEVSQIASSIARALDVNYTLSETLALAHDLGHAPFGHHGQEVLNKLMKNYGGFEHNYNTLRIGTELESPYIGHEGLNLMYETLEGMLKHCSDKKAMSLTNSKNEFLISLGQRFLSRKSTSIEAQIVDFADSIAYLHSDLEDAINMEIVNPEVLANYSSRFLEKWEKTIALYPEYNFKHKKIIHQAIRDMMGETISDLIYTSKTIIQNARINTLDDVRNSPQLINYSDNEMKNQYELKKTSRKLIYENKIFEEPKKTQEEMLTFLFNIYLKEIESNNQFDKTNIHQIVCDQISSLTDRGVFREYRKQKELSNDSSRIIQFKIHK